VNAKDSNGRTAFYLASETGHTEIVQLLEKNYREMKQQKLNDEIISQPQEVPSLSRLAANSLPPDVKSDYNAESGEFSLIDLNPRRLDKFGGKRKSKKSNRKTHKARRK
jgi:ankyrin repeat protein